ncbi:MAG: M28 family peptidase [Flavisolibacter sp.]
MKHFISILFAIILFTNSNAQQAISVSEVTRIETVLSSNEMRGRRAGTPDIDKAANFIADEFKKAGLQTMKGNSFLQEFIMIKPKLMLQKVEFDEKDADVEKVVVISSKKDFKVNEKSGFETAVIPAGANFFAQAWELFQMQKNLIVFVDTSFTKNFPRLKQFSRNLMKDGNDVVFVLGDQPKKFTIKLEQELTETKFSNVVGMIPGKSKKNEYVIFSAHYDHLGIAAKPVNGDSIYNGANDDAAGTTAVMVLANHFKKLNNNERTLIFAAFTAEEIGGFGSQYFSKQIDPAQAIAMFNIEMIGTDSKWGKNSAFITGFEKTNMGEILQNNLKGSSFSFYADPYPDQDLFYRSDNATLAKLGVPAHTISTSKMDSEPNYHKVSDEVSTLDLENMTEIIKAIAMSSVSIVNGKDSPTRVKPEDVKR